MSNNKLNTAIKNRDNEFYTQYEDVEKELIHYSSQLHNKIVYCPCDSKESSFFKYFYDNFKKIGLKKLIISNFDDVQGQYTTYDGLVLEEGFLEGTGSILEKEVQDIISECDVVITNPPFSLMHSFLGILVERRIDFLIVCSCLTPSYLKMYDLIYNGIIKYGYNYPTRFTRPDKSIKLVACAWLTTLETKKDITITLTNTYNPEEYPKYDNFDAINTTKTKNIPYDYEDYIGIPITALTKFSSDGVLYADTPEGLVRFKMIYRPFYKLFFGPKAVFSRIIIQKIKK